MGLKWDGYHLYSLIIHTFMSTIESFTLISRIGPIAASRQRLWISAQEYPSLRVVRSFTSFSDSVFSFFFRRIDSNECRVSASGNGMYSRFTNRRLAAYSWYKLSTPTSSRSWGRFVAPITRIFPFSLAEVIPSSWTRNSVLIRRVPSISFSLYITSFHWSCPRIDSNESISSMNITDGYTIQTIPYVYCFKFSNSK